MRRLPLSMRCFRVTTFAALAAFLPITAWTQEEPATTPAEPQVGVIRTSGMAGIVSSVNPSQMELTVPEHVIFTVNIGPSTQITENGHAASLDKIRIPSAVRVHGVFDLQAHTVEAEAIDLLPPKALRMLESRSANFLTLWTSGTVTDVKPDSVVLQLMDGNVQTVQLSADTSYDHHAQPVSFSWLRKGELVDVQFSTSYSPLARSIIIRGMVPQTLNAQATPHAQEPAEPKVEAEQLSKPSCRYCPDPQFPNEARKDGISSGRALLEITVSEKGDVDPHDIRVIEDPGHGFMKEAVAILKKWKFKPAIDKDGKPAKTRIPVEFRWHSNL